MKKEIPSYIEMMIQRIKAGKASFNSPVGYKKVWENGKKTVVEDETSSPIIRDIFELYSSGEYAINDVAKIVSKKYKRSLGKSWIHSALRNPFYKGIMKLKGFEFEHPYPLFIEKEVWETCNTILDVHRQKSKTPEVDKDMYTYRKIIRCGICNNFLTSQTREGIVYYNCGRIARHPEVSKKKFAREEEITNYLSVILKQQGIENFTETYEGNKKEARRFLEKNLFYFSYAGGIFEHKLRINLSYKYPDTTSLIEGNDPLLNFLKTSRDMEEISQFLQKDTVECSNILMDYILEDKIEENSGLWKIK